MSGRADELARQAALLALLSGDVACAATVVDATDAAGLLAYQRNAQATARRVLRAHFPTVAAMLGEETLDAVALILWRLSPPASGDLGEWGAALPDLLARHPDLQAWPWLADSARLDWARHLCERAADAALDAASLQRLGDTDPEHLQLVLVPGLRLLSSPWPLLALWEAHQADTERDGVSPCDEGMQERQARSTLEALAPLLSAAARRPDGDTLSGGPLRHVLVWRGADWRIQMNELPQAQADWMRLLVEAADMAHDARPPLSRLLNQASADFDFSAWLQYAVSAGCLWRVGVLASNDI